MKEKIIADAKARMQKSVETVRTEFSSIRTGRASPALLDGITVDYYGTQVPLKQIATVATPDSKLLTVTPWDRAALPAIEKAIQESNLGLNPLRDAQLIRLPIPPLTEERRKELVKVVHRLAEEGKVAIRNIRRDENDAIKKRQKGGEIPEDDAHHMTSEIQKLTDDFIEQISKLIELKEKEIMEV